MDYPVLRLYPDSDFRVNPEISTDAPQTSDTRALLLNGITQVIEQMAEAITGYAGERANIKDSSRQTAVFAIYGGWGTGKTTFLRDLRAKLSEKEAISTVWFNLWEHEQDAQPIVAMLQQAALELDKKVGSGAGEKARSVLKTLMASLVDMGSGFVGKASGGMISPPTYAGLSSRYKDFKKDSLLVLDDQSKREQSFRDVVSELTCHQKRPVVFFVDDPDRCVPEVAAQMLEKIRLFLTLPGCIFVIGAEDSSIRRVVGESYFSNYEREAIRSAVRSKAGGDNQAELDAKVEQAIMKRKEEIGRGYLEKIVQHPFYLPALGSDDLRSFLESILGHNGVPSDDSDKALEVLYNGLVAANASRRQIIRTANAYTLSYYLGDPALKSDHDPAITAFVSVLQVLYPEKYAKLLRGDRRRKMYALLASWETEEDSESPDQQYEIPGLLKMAGVIGFESGDVVGVDEDGELIGPGAERVNLLPKYLEISSVAASPTEEGSTVNQRPCHRSQQGKGEPEE